MAQAISIQNEDINGIVGGGAVALLTPSTTNYYNLYSSSATALTGAVTVAASATPAGFVVFNMLLSTSLTYSGAGAFTFFGTSVSEGYMKAGTLFQATYNGSAYTVTILPSFSQSGFIQGSDIADTTIALTKLAALPSAEIIVGSGANVPTAVAMSGDATIDNAGAVTIANDAVTTPKIIDDAVTTPKIIDEAVTLAKLETSLQAYFGTPNTIIYESVTIPTADVLTGFATPVVLVGAVAGKIILPVYVIEELDFNSVAYATNGRTYIKHDGATDPIFEASGNSFLFGTVSKSVLMAVSTPAAVTDTQLLVNADLLWTVDSANPTAGDSDITIKIGYILI
jgi:hypothetical protein